MEHRVSVFGLGYVGSVTAACLAARGNRVVGVDTNAQKVETVNSGRSPVLEAQVEGMIKEAVQDGRLEATEDGRQAIHDTDLSIVCVGTPSERNGSLDVSIVQRVCESIGAAVADKSAPHTVVMRSTVLPGTARGVVIPALERSSGKAAGDGLKVCVNPEFMREGSAVSDFLEPPFTVLGAASADDLEVLRSVYSWVEGPVFETSLEEAEMVKYASNAFHALKVAFANEVGALCKAMGMDADRVSEIFLADRRLNVSPAYLKPGFAFGGSCLPKDLRALTYRGKELDLELPLLDSVMTSNESHLDRAVEMILELGRRRVALLGLSFKAGTDDLRESPQVALAKRLIGEGYEIRVWDPHVSLGQLLGSNRDFIREHIPHIGSLLDHNLADVVGSADVVVIASSDIDRQALAAVVNADQHVIDLVNVDRTDRPLGDRPRYDGICW